MIDVKTVEIIDRWHNLCVTQGFSGRWVLQLVVRDGQIVSYSQPSQTIVFGQSSGKLDDVRNRNAVDSLKRWFADRKVENGRIVMYVEYTNGVTSASRVYCGVLTSVLECS